MSANARQHYETDRPFEGCHSTTSDKGHIIRAATIEERKRTRTAIGTRGSPLRGKLMEGAIVATVTVRVTALPPLGASEVGEIEQVASEGAPLQVKVTVPPNPPMGALGASYC